MRRWYYPVTIREVSTNDKGKFLWIESKSFLESASVTQAKIQNRFCGDIFDLVLTVLVDLSIYQGVFSKQYFILIL